MMALMATIEMLNKPALVAAAACPLRAVAAVFCLVAFAAPALAFTLPPVTNQAARSECTACHMIFPPQMLPARSWVKLMATLDNHFKENATLDDKTRSDILAYLKANAADSPHYRRITALLQGVPANATPLRITDIPWWRRIHGSPDAYYFQDPRVTSAANCGACHRNAPNGQF
jgi:hypothetical protein